jgi:hypothetical protein
MSTVDGSSSASRTTSTASTASAGPPTPQVPHRVEPRGRCTASPNASKLWAEPDEDTLRAVQALYLKAEGGLESGT